MRVFTVLKLKLNVLSVVSDTLHSSDAEEYNSRNDKSSSENKAFTIFQE